MRGLYKRGNYYWMSYRIKGKRYFESTGVTTMRQAEDILSRIRQQIKEGKTPESKKDKKYNFAALSHEYLKWAERQRSYKDKKMWIKQLNEVFGNLDLDELTTLRIEQLQTERLKRNKPSTVNRVLATLKHMISKGYQWEMVNDYTLKQVKNVKLLEENNRRLRFLTTEECQRLIDCCGKHLKPIVTVALNTGMRKSEILNLKWEQVDLKHGFILLDTTKNGERREIPINTTVEYLFQDMLSSRNGAFVFPDDRTGKPFGTIKKSFATALEKASILDFRFHDLRHTFASHLVMGGIDLTSVKELLGHKTLTMTMRYAHLSPSHKRRAVNLLDKVLSENGENKNGDNLVTFDQNPNHPKSPKSL